MSMEVICFPSRPFPSLTPIPPFPPFFFSPSLISAFPFSTFPVSLLLLSFHLCSSPFPAFALLISFPSLPLPHKSNQGSACVVSSLTGCEQSPATKRFSVHSHTETKQSSTCMSMARFHDFCCKQNLLVRLLWGANGLAPTGFWRWGRVPPRPIESALWRLCPVRLCY